jgi:long-chain acyl-CoA synthetase
LVANAVQSHQWLRGWGYGEIPRDPLPIILCAIPFFHMYGVTLMNEGILLGSTLIPVPRPEPKTILSAIQKYKINYFAGIPLIFEALLKYPKIKDYDLGSLPFCISGGDFLPTGLAKEFAEITGTEILEGYGLTEASPITHLNPIDKDKRRSKSIGIPFPDTDAKIVDIETGTKDLAPNEVGELVVRGPQVMKGYWNMPEEDVYALRDGWLYTGDVATMDTDGYFYIIDRKKYLIQSSGMNVWSRKIEEILSKHPAVKEAAVIGLEDPYRCASGIKAFVVLHDSFQGKIGAKDLIDFAKQYAADYEIPEAVEFREELPRTPLGKIDKIALKRETKPS